MRFPALAVFLLSAATLAHTQSAASTTAPWDYEGKRGALTWGKLDPAYKACSEGHEQSPIDIRGAHLNKALQPIEFHYISGPVTLENNGKNVIVHVDPGSYIVAGGVRYHQVTASRYCVHQMRDDPVWVIAVADQEQDPDQHDGDRIHHETAALKETNYVTEEAHRADSHA